MKQSNYLGGTLLYAIMSLLFLIPLSAYAQNYQLKGYVLDSNDEPLIGANVVVTGTTNGMITDLNGEFVLVVLQMIELMSLIWDISSRLFL